MHDLIDSYLPNDFIKPKRWCETIAETDHLCCELYAIAAKYFAMIGEYDTADALTEIGMELCSEADQSAFLFSSPETMLPRLDKQKGDTHRYRTKKPYWPKTEERRRAVAMFYDEKGIKYDRIEGRPKKVPENEFAPIRECFEDTLTNYSAFWCCEMFSVSAAKCIYQIGAVKVVNGKETDSFEAFIRPWDASVHARKSAAKEAGVPLEVIEAAVLSGVTEIKTTAFFDCKKLKDLWVSEKLKYVDPDVFPPDAQLTIHAPEGSFAEQYAKRKHFSFEPT